jgi:2-keto-3-deoxy-L-rhamnonate aldolase RhmA
MKPTMRPNAMKAKLARGEVALGCSLMFPSPQLVEMIAYAGFDWVLIDCEHGSIGPADVELMAMAADASGITAIGRPKTNSSADISALMDRGIGGVQVPHINSADDARRAVAAVKFGPGANGGNGRGLAAGTRPDRWGLGSKMTDFVATANAQSLVCVQIEHVAALPNVDEICQVEGVDVVFIGPSDLSQSMGHPGNPSAPAVATAIRATLAKIASSGKTPGMPATTDALPGVIASGNRYIYTHLPKLLGAGAAAYLAAGKPASA